MHLQILRERLQTQEPSTVPIPNSDANTAIHYSIWIIVSLKPSLLCCTVEKTHYSGSARNYLCGEECAPVPVLHCDKVLSVGLSSCLGAISFWKKLTLKTHWNGSVVMDLQLLHFPVSSNVPPSLPVLSYQPGNTAALLSGSANESSRMEVTPTYCKLILSKALAELLASPNEIWSGWYCSQKMLMFFSKWQMELDIVYIRSKLFSSAFTFLLQRTYKHLFSFYFL